MLLFNKLNTYILKHAIILTLIATLALTNVRAQEKTDGKDNGQKTKKELRNDGQKKQFENNYQLLLSKNFVIEANRVNGHEVYSNENFFEVSGDSSYLQVTPMQGMTARSGFSGFIYAGKIMDYKITRDEKRYSCTVSLWFKTRQIMRREVTITVSMAGNAILNSGEVRMVGVIKDVQSSNLAPRIPLN